MASSLATPKDRTDQPSASPVHPDERPSWAARPIVAAALRATIFLAPFCSSLVASYLVARRWPRPAGFAASMIWLATLICVGGVVMLAVGRLARRLLPLAVLLRMTLIFPDQAPNRFGLALRTGTTRQLERRLEDVRSRGLGDTEADAAETLLQLVAALRDHDRFTRGHGERVRAYSAMIGEELGLDPVEISKLQWAGLIHDVGKLAVPEEVLNKPGRLTADEYELVKTHPAEGMAMVGPLTGWLGDWALAVGDHHERWDGGGYPSGLAGEDISLAGRIVAVADTFDVVTATRSYKPAQSPQWARRELERNAGTQFDPQVVRAFLNVSIGQLRGVMWPLAWIAHVPFFGSTVAAPAAGVAATTMAVVGSSVVGGAMGSAPPDDHDPVEVARVAIVDVAAPDDSITVSTVPVGAPPVDGAASPNPIGPDTPTAGSVGTDDGTADAGAVPVTTIGTVTLPPVIVTTPPTTASAVSATGGTTLEPVDPGIADPPPTIIVLPPVPTSTPTPTTTAAPATTPATSPATSPATTTPATTPATTTPPAPTTTAAPTEPEPVTTTATTVAAAPTTIAPAADPDTADCARAQAGGLDLADADLSGCDLAGARLWGVDLTGAKLNDADLTGASLAAFDLDGASLRNVRLVDAVLTGGTMRGVEAQGIDARNVRIDLVDASEANLSDGDFSNARLRGVSFADARARGVDFSSARLDAVSFVRAELHDADFSEATLTLVDMSGAVLRGANLALADLRGLNLADADLRGAVLSGADLTASRLGGADVRDVDFVEARLADVVGVPGAWSGAGFADTVCPDGMVRSSACWS